MRFARPSGRRKRARSRASCFPAIASRSTGRLMTAQRVAPNGRWTAFTGAEGDGATAILDAVEVPIVVVRRDFTVGCFNKAAADVLDLSPSDIGRTPGGIAILAGAARLEQECD